MKIAYLISIFCGFFFTGLGGINQPTNDQTQSNDLQLHVRRLSYEEEVRPFITDDARVVGKRLAQLESWIRFDRESGEQWLMSAFGPNDRLELSLGGVFGYDINEEGNTSFSYALPLMQAKYLLRPYEPNGLPGFGAVLGTFLPFGRGGVKPHAYGSFGFLTLSQCYGEGEKYLFHLNVGGNYLYNRGNHEWLATWGLGTQLNVYKGMHLVGEIFSGDPYVPGAGISYQLGYRYFFSDLFQIDMTIGEGINGDSKLPFWFSAGVRIVLECFMKN